MVWRRNRYSEAHSEGYPGATKMFERTISIVIILALVLGAGSLIYWYFVPAVPISKSTSDETADWKIYRNEEYGYEMRYPEGWIAKHSSGYNDEFGIYYESNSFEGPDGSYILSFGIVPKDSDIMTPSLRTGVQAGDFVDSGEVVNIGGIEVSFKKLVYEGRVKEIFFNPFEIGDFRGNATLSYFGSTSLPELPEYDMTGKPELDVAKKILATFELLD
ncbi:hypothetical protein A2V68_00985 [candidate division Kazan bacterium RBG_13_50_9]|uniref:Uncharacterized protein n=1 Tax=candidate division Kazan bacterium RBG_13_50_9 TaxID=1798535 RepID=A0A1F4NSH2_UNCK3|nr:MAG: hypothetical protein A2V68_00985 [candidate division Kazan bacterium RBG_13_50_9]